MDPFNDIELQSNKNNTNDLDNSNDQSIFSCLSPIPMNVQTPMIKTDSKANQEKLTSNTPLSSVNTILPKRNKESKTPKLNIIEVDPNTTPSLSPNLSVNLDFSSSSPKESNFVGLEGDLDILKGLRTKHINNPSIGYLNINSLRGNKFSQLETICKLSKIDILCIDKTKLSSEIPTSRIFIEGYQYPPIRRDRKQKSTNSYGGGKVVYIREGFICKRINEFETKTSETICIELSLKNKKWFIMFGYRPESIKREIFFEEINITLSKAINKYKNILFIGDLNIDLNIPNHDNTFCRIYVIFLI